MVSYNLYAIIPSPVDDSVWGVSESPYPGMLVRLQRGEVRITAAVQSDYGKVQALVGAENLAIAFGVGADCQPRRPHSKYIEKLTTIDHSSPIYSTPQQYTRVLPECAKRLRQSNYYQ